MGSCFVFCQYFSGAALFYDLPFFQQYYTVTKSFDGFQVMAEMKRMNRSVPIIVLSALSQRETVVKALKNGVTSYIIKPLDPVSVLNKAKEILKANF